MDRLIELLGKMFLFVEDVDMQIPIDANLLYVVFKLMDRSLAAGQIDRGLRRLVGNNWRTIPVSTWHQRLLNEGFVLYEKNRFFINDLIDNLEVLIKGKIRLNT